MSRAITRMELSILAACREVYQYTWDDLEENAPRTEAIKTLDRTLFKYYVKRRKPKDKRRG